MPTQRRFSSVARAESASGWIDGRPVDEHYGNIILHRVHSPASLALQRLWLRSVGQRLLASRADKHFEQFLGNHGLKIVRHFGPS